MHIAVPQRTGGLAASGLLLGSVAAGRVVVHRLLRSSLAAGEILQRRMLGTEAHYRVVGSVAETVEVEVLVAPGLEPGMHVRWLSADAAHAVSRRSATGVARAFPPVSPARSAA